MSQTDSPSTAVAVIDGKAELLPARPDNSQALALVPPAAAPAVELTPEQQAQLERCAFYLHRLSRRIAARENDLIYLYVEAGFYLLKAREAHLCATVAHRLTGLNEDRGFRGWLEAAPEEDRMPHRTAYRYLQAARNAGLTADSTPVALQALRDEKKLANQTLTTLCRKPIDKTDAVAELHEVTPEEAQALEAEEILKFWTDWGESTTERGLNEQDWAKYLTQDQIAGINGIAHDMYQRTKAALRKPKALPGGKAK